MRVRNYFPVFEERIFGLMAVGIILGLIVMVWRSNASFPDTIKYIDPDGDLIVISSPIKSQWDALKGHIDHLKEYLTHEDESAILLILEKIKDELEKEKIELKEFEDLEELGIDPYMPWVFSLDIINKRKQKWVMALPVANKDSLLKLIKGKTTVRLTDSTRNIFETRENAIAFSKDHKIAIIASQKEYLIERLDNIETANSFFRNSDSEKNRYKSFLQSNESSRGWIYFKLRKNSLDKMLLSKNQLESQDNSIQPFDIWGDLNISNEILKVSLDVHIDPGNFKSVRSLQKRHKYLNNRIENIITPFTIYYEDDYLQDYYFLFKPFLEEQIRDAVQNDPYHKRNNNFYREIYLALLDTKDLNGFGINFLDFRGELPEFLARLNINKSIADSLVYDFQKKARIRRDSIILRTLSSKMNDTIIIDSLFEEKFDFWTRYVIEKDLKTIIPNPAFTLNDFNTPNYNYSIKEKEVKYLFPPFTANDLRFRMDTLSSEPFDTLSLFKNHYRLSSYYEDDALILGLDSITFGKFFEQNKDRLKSQENFKQLISEGEINDPKGILFFDPKWMVDQSAIYSPLIGEQGSEIENQANRILNDIQIYDFFLLSFSGNPEENDFNISLILGYN